MPTIWLASISTFRGTSFNAIHYYGALYGPNGSKYPIMHFLSKEQADELTEKDGYSFWHEGETSNRWDHETDVREACLAAWPTLANEGDVLLFGHPWARAMVEPWLEPAAGPPEFMLRATELYIEAKDLEWATDEAQLECATDEWRAFLKGLDLSWPDHTSFDERPEEEDINMEQDSDGKWLVYDREPYDRYGEPTELVAPSGPFVEES